MKRPLTILTAGFLVLTACSAPSETVKKGAPTTTSHSAQVPVSDSCETLIGDDGGLVSEAAAFLRDIQDLTPETRREAEDISGKIGDVARTAKAELKEPLAGMQKPLDGIAQSGDGFTLEPVEFKAAGNSVIDICSGESATSTPTRPSVSPTTSRPSATTAAETFESEFLAAGIPTGYGNPSIAEYSKLPVETLCNPEITDTSHNFRELVRIWTGGGYPEDEAKSMGKGKTLTRLIVKYHCPDRLDGLTAIIGTGS